MAGSFGTKRCACCGGNCTCLTDLVGGSPDYGTITLEAGVVCDSDCNPANAANCTDGVDFDVFDPGTCDGAPGSSTLTMPVSTTMDNGTDIEIDVADGITELRCVDLSFNTDFCQLAGDPPHTSVMFNYVDPLVSHTYTYTITLTPPSGKRVSAFWIAVCAGGFGDSDIDVVMTSSGGVTSETLTFTTSPFSDTCTAEGPLCIAEDEEGIQTIEITTTNAVGIAIGTPFVCLAAA